MENILLIHFLLLILDLVFTEPIDPLTISHRSLRTADTFTPAEMLLIAEKLIKKVEDPGIGKGIVSSARNAEDLADKLFESFFLTTKRIVNLQDFDISGLDALQALALSGEVANNPDIVESVTEAAKSEDLRFHRGQVIKVNNEAKKCKYKLVTKKVDNIFPKRRGIELAKKLKKKRRLIVKSKRRALKTNNNTTTNDNTRDSGITKQACHWRYECNNPGDLDSCQLHTQCAIHNETMTTADYIHNQQKDQETLRRFRKMVGLSIVDEEVEKILETRILYLKPNNLDPNDRVESLKEYFNKIILYQHIETSTAITPSTSSYVKSNGINELSESAVKDESLQKTSSEENLNVESRKRINKMSRKKRQF